jgi:hypothetical protein
MRIGFFWLLIGSSGCSLKHGTMCDSLIPGIALACRWSVECGKLIMYPSTFEHVSTCVYMSYRPNEPFVPKQQRKQYLSAVHCWQKNEWQESGAADKIEFRVTIGESASETLDLLILNYAKHALKKLSVNGVGGLRKGEEMCKMAWEVGCQKRKEQKQMWTEYEHWCAQIGD